MGRASSSKHAVVALRSPHGAGQHRHQQQHQQPGSPSISIASPASSASSSSSSSSSSSAQAPSPRVSLAAALSCRHCGKGETWGLHQLPAETLAYSRWSDSNNRGYLMFRSFLAVYWSYITILAGSITAKDVRVPSGFAFNNQYGAHFFLYVTYWTCLLESAYFILALLAALLPRQRGLYRTTWALRSIVAPAACLVSLLYWTLIFPATGITDYVDSSIHLCNAIFMLLDVAVSRLPLYAKHFWLPFIYTLVYSIFNGVYVGAGGKDSHGKNHIYEVLNYKPLGTSLALLGGVLFVALPCLYALLWLENRVCLYLSGALTTVQPDHELLTPEPAQPLPAAEGEGEREREGQEGPKASPTTLSPGGLKLVEAEMGIPEHSGVHHRPHMHHQHGHAGPAASKPSCA